MKRAVTWLHTGRIIPRRIKHHFRWALIHAALVLFFADLIAAFWPAFREVWEGKSHVAIAAAAFLATAAEYIHDEIEDDK